MQRREVYAVNGWLNSGMTYPMYHYAHRDIDWKCGVAMFVALAAWWAYCEWRERA